MKNWLKKNWGVILILIVALLLFGKPLFSNQPLGLDAIGHLSKVSYLQEFPFADWDMSWYSGSLFLKMYPPLFYYAVSVFQNVFFGSNLICFFSLLFSALGIYFLVDYLTKDKRLPVISGVGFFTVLSLSYYWIGTANLPYFAALWTIPFSLYFLEKSIQEKKKKHFIFYSLVFFVSILTHVITGFLVGIFMVIRFLFEGFDFKNLKKILFYGGIPVLLSAFWFIPFLFFSKSAGEYSGYVPRFLQLFGTNDSISWGVQAGGVGVIFGIFLVVLFLSLLNIKKINKTTWYYLTLSGILCFLLCGGLGKHYPYGVDPVRFILPFSIIIIIASALLIKERNLSKSKLFSVSLVLLLLLGLSWNLSVTEQNFERFSYHKEDSRYRIFMDIQNRGLPFENKFENYRFGTSKFVFGEMINYFMPRVPQTFGYQDAGMLDAPRYYDMRWHIWTSEDIEDSIYWLDWFGIKYFEVEDSEVSYKFINNPRFRQVMNYSDRYVFTMYEYLDAKPIISLVDNLQEDSVAITKMGAVKNFEFERIHPDKITITYDEIDDDDVVLFKEFYHENWRAKELGSGDEIEIKKVGPGFMGAYPEETSAGVVFYYKKSFVEYLSILLSLLALSILIFSGKNFKKYL